jgi:hypothetical protein
VKLVLDWSRHTMSDRFVVNLACCLECVVNSVVTWFDLDLTFDGVVDLVAERVIRRSENVIELEDRRKRIT